MLPPLRWQPTQWDSKRAAPSAAAWTGAGAAQSQSINSNPASQVIRGSSNQLASVCSCDETELEKRRVDVHQATAGARAWPVGYAKRISAFAAAFRRLAGPNPCAAPAPQAWLYAIETLAQDLELAIDERFGPDQPIDLLGFSMGAVISRTWLQLYGGYRRTRRFVSLGSPQHGTLVAQPWPRVLVPGVADMKVGSALLRQLNSDSSLLRGIDCISFYCPWDLMVIPAWTGVLPVGPIVRLPVWNHRELIQSPRSLVPVSSHLLAG